MGATTSATNTRRRRHMETPGQTIANPGGGPGCKDAGTAASWCRCAGLEVHNCNRVMPHHRWSCEQSPDHAWQPCPPDHAPANRSRAGEASVRRLARGRTQRGQGRRGLPTAGEAVVGKVDHGATSATPGRPSSAIISPTTNTSGCPGSEQSGATCTRPARSTVACARSASSRPRDEACTPAAQMLVRASMRPPAPSVVAGVAVVAGDVGDRLALGVVGVAGADGVVDAPVLAE